LRSSPEEIDRILQDLSFASRAIEKELAEICWYMRGSIDWFQVHTLTFDQRKVINKVIREKIELVEKTKLPIL